MRISFTPKSQAQFAIALLFLVSGGGCQSLPTGTAAHNVQKPVQLVTLAQTRLVSDPEREGEFKNLIVVQAYLLDKYMQTIDARGTFNFHVYLDGTNTERGVEPDHQWRFTAEDAARWKSQGNGGTGYAFELPVTADKEVASRVGVVAVYTNPDGSRLMSKNDLANVPTVSRYDHSTKRTVVTKEKNESAPGPLPTRDSAKLAAEAAASLH